MSSADGTRSRSELVAAIPRLRELAAELQITLGEAQREGWRDTSAGAVHEAAEVDALWQATIVVDRIAEAAAAPGRADKLERLVDAADRAGSVIDAVHRRLAELQTGAELAAGEMERQILDGDTGAVMNTARLEVVLPAETTATVTITFDGSGQVAWRSDSLTLADVGGVDQLAVAAALRMLGQALTRALHDAAFGPADSTE